MSRLGLHMDSVLAKLNEMADDDGIAALTKLAIERLDYENDERIATQLLLSILSHDDLAETLDGRL